MYEASFVRNHFSNDRKAPRNNFLIRWVVEGGQSAGNIGKYDIFEKQEAIFYYTSFYINLWHKLW